MTKGTRLFRVHHKKYPATSFNPNSPSSDLDGGRFDCLQVGSPAFLYAGQDESCALAEALLRYVPPLPATQVLLRVKLKSLRLSEIEVRQDLTLVSLRGADVRHVGPGVELTKCPADRYPSTRLWAAAIRRWVPGAGGFVWWSRYDEERLAYVLYDHVVRSSDLTMKSTIQLDAPEAVQKLRSLLAPYNVAL